MPLHSECRKLLTPCSTLPQEQQGRSVGALQSAVREQDSVIKDIATRGVDSSDTAVKKRQAAQRSRILTAAPILTAFASGSSKRNAVSDLKLYVQKTDGELNEQLRQQNGRWSATAAYDCFNASTVTGQGAGKSKKEARNAAAADVLRMLHGAKA